MKTAATILALALVCGEASAQMKVDAEVNQTGRNQFSVSVLGASILGQAKTMEMAILHASGFCVEAGFSSMQVLNRSLDGSFGYGHHAEIEVLLLDGGEDTITCQDEISGTGFVKALPKIVWA